MRTNILLLGAGFSRNWGGWLAAEAFEYLLGDAEIRRHKDIVQLLWRSRARGGFEAALAEVQREFLRNSASRDKLDALQGAVSRMFDDMNGVFFQQTGMEFSNSTGSLVRELLVRFDAIFSLNQDLLLERHYMNDNVALSGARRWDAAVLPGVRPPPNLGPLPQDWRNARWTVDAPRELPRRSQPVFKLHGSAQWRTPEGADLLVIGGAKTAAIGANGVLKWYHEQFAQMLTRPDARLMVIGYGFADHHIDEAIRKGVEAGLQAFIVDPLGVDVVNKTRDAPIRVADPLEDALIGASRRTLREIFGGDAIERGKLMRFFAD